MTGYVTENEGNRQWIKGNFYYIKLLTAILR